MCSTLCRVVGSQFLSRSLFSVSFSPALGPSRARVVRLMSSMCPETHRGSFPRFYLYLYIICAVCPRFLLGSFGTGKKKKIDHVALRPLASRFIRSNRRVENREFHVQTNHTEPRLYHNARERVHDIILQRGLRPFPRAPLF